LDWDFLLNISKLFSYKIPKKFLKLTWGKWNNQGEIHTVVCGVGGASTARRSKDGGASTTVHHRTPPNFYFYWILW
jgi:hypothetical protein